MGELLNLVGLSTGVVLYTMLLAMVVRGSRTPGVPSRFDRLLLATSLLGLVWNLCALPAYELPKVGEVTIRGALERAADGSFDLFLTVTDTGSGVSAAELRRGRAVGVGLSNVERRLRGQPINP
jgi:hypothetical protein